MIALPAIGRHNYATAIGKPGMQRLSTPSIFLSHLEIARQFVAGVANRGDIEAIFDVLEQSGSEIGSRQKLAAAEAVAVPKLVPLTAAELANIPFPYSQRANGTCGAGAFLCVAVFNLAEDMAHAEDEFCAALVSGSFRGCTISEDVEKRLRLALDRPKLAAHFYKSAVDHFISDILKLLDQVPGVVPIGSRGRIWLASSTSKDIKNDLAWIEEAGLSNFVSLVVHRQERGSDD